MERSRLKNKANKLEQTIDLASCKKKKKFGRFIK